MKWSIPHWKQEPPVGKEKQPWLARWFHNAKSPWLLVEGFALVIVIGTILLWLPISVYPGHQLNLIEALFTATSAVCVTGLTVVPTSTTFNWFGKTVIGILIQIGGMGIVLFLIAFMLIGKDKLGFKARSMFVTAQNLFGYANVVDMARRIVLMTIIVEGTGAFLSFLIFLQDYDFWHALGYGIFHSVSAFNNAGFDLFGGSDSMLMYASNTPMIMLTSALVIIGGFGFIAFLDILYNRFCFKHYKLTTKITLVMTVFLLVFGTVFFYFTTDQTLLEAWFQSVIARTAGFNSFPLANFTPAALIIFIVLMFIGASPNSTGGGVKTNTIFAAGLKAISATTAHDEDSAFYRRIPESIFTKSFIILLYGVVVILVGLLLILIAQPEFELMDLLVEVTSAFATVGSSVGITADLNEFSRCVIIVIMFIGRLGPITIANLLIHKPESKIEFTEENILIG